MATNSDSDSDKANSEGSGLSDNESDKDDEAADDVEIPAFVMRRRASLEDVLAMTAFAVAPTPDPAAASMKRRASLGSIQSDDDIFCSGAADAAGIYGTDGPLNRGRRKSVTCTELDLPPGVMMGRRRSVGDLDPAHMPPGFNRGRRGSCADLPTTLPDFRDKLLITGADRGRGRRASCGDLAASLADFQKLTEAPPTDAPEKDSTDGIMLPMVKRRGSINGGRSSSKRSKGRRGSTTRLKSLEEQQDLSPQELEEQALEALRVRLETMFGDAAEACRNLDWAGTGLLSYEDLQANLADWEIDVQTLTKPSVDFQRIFNLLDIDGSGQLNISEFMEVCPWRAEDEGVLLLRHNLSQALGSKEAVFEALDTNKDGRICFQELKKGLEKLAIDIKQVTGGVELNRIYNLLDHDLSGELSLSELLEADCRKEAQFRDDIITQLRTDLLAHFGDNESLLTALDANSNGELSLLEMKQGFKDARFNASGSISGASLSWVFKVLDADGSGSLSIHELMVQDPADDAKRFKEARRPRFNKRREQNALSGGRRKSAADCDDGIPELSPRRVEDLTPALQKVALFGKEVVKSAEQRRVSLAEWGAGTLASDPKPRPLEMQVLDLSNCFIERDGAARLAHALLESRMDKLEVLELSGNYIGPEGVTWISSSIQKHTSLRLLGLAWNLVDDDGAKRLSTLARKVRTLNELDLRFNRIGDDGALQLSKLLASKSRFTRLDLGYNQIEKEGCSKCVSAARKNKTTLILQGNLGHKGTVLAHKGNPVVAAPYGGMMLPKIKDLVVAGWPRSGVSRDGPRKKKGKPGSKPGSALAGDAPRTASALGRMMPQPWPPSIELSRSMTEAKLQGISPARAWSREACTKHSLPGLEDAFPGPSRGQRRQLGTS